jgi:hypothetical protein
MTSPVENFTTFTLVLEGDLQAYFGGYSGRCLGSLLLPLPRLRAFNVQEYDGKSGTFLGRGCLTFPSSSNLSLAFGQLRLVTPLRLTKMLS